MFPPRELVSFSTLWQSLQHYFGLQQSCGVCNAVNAENCIDFVTHVIHDATCQDHINMKSKEP